MKKLLLVFSTAMMLTASALGTFASGAFALTNEQARLRSGSYANSQWGHFAYVWECVPSGKNEAGHAQYYCYGYFEEQAGEWKVNVGPYGEITYAQE